MFHIVANLLSVSSASSKSTRSRASATCKICILKGPPRNRMLSPRTVRARPNCFDVSSPHDAGSLWFMSSPTSFTTSKTSLNSSVTDGSQDCLFALISTVRPLPSLFLALGLTSVLAAFLVKYRAQNTIFNILDVKECIENIKRTTQARPQTPASRTSPRYQAWLPTRWTRGYHPQDQCPVPPGRRPVACPALRW